MLAYGRCLLNTGAFPDIDKCLVQVRCLIEVATITGFTVYETGRVYSLSVSHPFIFSFFRLY